jgi:hypothetical protein
VFKRRGRILFLDPGDGTRARMAEAWALALGGDWVEPQPACVRAATPDPRLVAVMAERNVPARAEGCPVWGDLREHPWDLVVPMEVGTGEDWPALLGPVRAKYWDLRASCGPTAGGRVPADLGVCRDVLRDRVSGLVGGFRMKAREGSGLTNAIRGDAP